MAESDTEISNIVEQVVIDAILEVERSLQENDQNLSVLTNSPEYAPTMLLSPTLSHVTNPDVTVDPMDYELSVASAISSEKTRNKHYNAWLDKYLAANGGNLYPSRDEKNRLAAEMNISVDRVTRFFANRRRKQSKNKPKKGQASPVTIMATSGGLQQIVNEASAVSPQIVDFTQATPAQQIGGEEKEADNSLFEKTMVALSNNVQQLVASQELAQLTTLLHFAQQQQQSAENPQNQAEQDAKILAFQQPNVQLLMLILQQQLQSGASINLGSAAQQVQTYLLHQQLSQVQAQVQQVAQLQHQQQQQSKELQQQWGGSSISASPIINSDSEISEQSELSPRAYLQMLEQQQKAAAVSPNDLDRMRSPPFKDPHQLADPEMTKLLDVPSSSSSTSTDVFQFGDNSASSLAYSRLSEREKLAVAALTEFGNRSYIR